MFAALIFALARVMRWAIVVSATRKARAISATVSPPSMRSVRATRASGERAGWQQVNTSRRRSSSTGPVGSGGVSSVIIIAAWCLASRRDSRRMRSIALLPAVVVSHAPGLGGKPSTGHRSTAVRRASLTASSATSRSPKRRASEATTRPCSSRTIRSISAWTRGSALKRSGSFGLERSDLDGTAAGLRRLGGDLQCRVEVGCLDDPETAEVLLGLGERSVGRDHLVTGGVDGGRCLDRLQATAEDPVAVGLELLVERVDGVVDRLELVGCVRVGAVVVDGQHVLRHG